MPEIGTQGNLAIFANAVPLAFVPGHQTVFQGLEEEVDWNGKKVRYGLENFRGTEPDWGKVKFVYSDERHPNPFRMLLNPEEAIKEVNGREVGFGKDWSVVENGQPRLEGVSVFTDPAVEDLYNQGHLSLSTSFIAYLNDDGTRIKGKILPNHVFVFDKRKIKPRDKMAMFLNAEEGMPDDSEVKGLLAKILEKIEGLVAKPPDPAPAGTGMTNTNDGDTMNKELNDKITALENSLAEIKKTNEALVAENTALKEKVTGFENAEKKAKQDAAWAMTKAKLPVGMINAEDDSEKKLREQFESDPIGFANAVLDIKFKKSTKDQGQEFNNATDEDAQALKELEEMTGRK